MKKGFTIIELIIVIVMISIFAGFIGLICLGVKGCSHIQEKGLKNVASSVWEGTENTTNENPVPAEK